ncbi:hypothetical protein HCN44_010292 [Aphidius gifuensis]|uniref:Uncharacterized protein n=1 Tax=Aphidius gifuensis TaxID=684658 RepID=A0A834XXY4_APHGI|nr:hypothetical protein HCN44_010292 [Aphidius gifuensis]
MARVAAKTKLSEAEATLTAIQNGSAGGCTESANAESNKSGRGGGDNNSSRFWKRQYYALIRGQERK